VLGERQEVVATVAATGNPHPFAGRRSELPHDGWRDGLLPSAFDLLAR
jgi:hypothetical protein